MFFGSDTISFLMCCVECLMSSSTSVVRGCLASTGWSNETGVNGDSHQTGCSPWNNRLIHSIIITLILAAFSVSAFRQRVPFSSGHKPLAHCCKISSMQTSAAKLFAISSTMSRTWLLNPALDRCVFSDYSREQSTFFSRILSCSTEFCLDFTQQTGRQPFSSQWSLLTNFPFLSLVGWKELIWLTFPPLSPLTVRGLSGQWVYWQAVS